MPWANFSPQLPSIFALLADPSVIVDGLDSVLQTFQNVLQGQIFGVKLPLLGDLLANNPVSKAIGSIRTNLLQPLANLLRENNVGLDSLVTLIQDAGLQRPRPERPRHPAAVQRRRHERDRDGRATSTSR